MESQLDHEKGHGKIKKKWNEKEDEKLVAAMLDVLNSGSNYKPGKGFKPGIFNAVEQQLVISFPEAGIKAKPHRKTMKSDWFAMHDMLAWNNTNCFGWDYNNDMLEDSQHVWQAYIHDLCIVFGKDWANGRDAQLVADIKSDINREEQETTCDGLDDIDVDHPLKNPFRCSF
ncbi:hypothetical protein L1987_63496 [Smallanthus sonchifolius]|uniref:Uncharacterized protein n=1 Tax=Smallanthus sonchifolius TaxID=185202 RepID=A0ACB9CDF0_9ASTR|nr:hypothetical protein L1987_63496 [Smallanthus sonchifolius]